MVNLSRWGKNILLSSVLMSCICAVASAIDMKRDLPKDVEKKKTDVEEKAPARTEAKEDTKAVIPKLKGIKFVAAPAAIVKEGEKKEGIQTKDVPLLDNDSFKAIISPRLGKPVSMKTLSEITRDIVLYYRDHDRPVVDVIVPEQAIETGVVQILVMEGVVNDVKVEGNRWFDDKDFLDQVRLKKGDRILRSNLLSDVNWINDNPFHSADIVYSRGDEFGSTDITLRVQDRFPVRFYAGYEDNGTVNTGNERWFTGMNWGDAFGIGHQMNFQYTGSSDAWEDWGGHVDPRSQAWSGSYIVPLPWRHKLLFFGGYSKSRSNLPTPFDLTGVGWQTSMRYVVPLPEVLDATHSFQWGFDFKESNSNLDYGGANVFQTPTQVDQFVLAYNISRADSLGSTSFGITGYHSPGGWSNDNKDWNYQQTRTEASAEYSYVQISAERITKLPWDFSHVIRGTYQASSGNLISSEQLGVGGNDTVRGYDERQANGDEGWVLNNELRTPPVSLGELFGISGYNDQLQFLAFWDYGVAQIYHPLNGENKNEELSSVGPGMRYSVAPYLSLKFDYGFQLTNAANSRDSSRGHLSVVFAY